MCLSVIVTHGIKRRVNAWHLVRLKKANIAIGNDYKAANTLYGEIKQQIQRGQFRQYADF